MLRVLYRRTQRRGYIYIYNYTHIYSVFILCTELCTVSEGRAMCPSRPHKAVGWTSCAVRRPRNIIITLCVLSTKLWGICGLFLTPPYHQHPAHVPPPFFNGGMEEFHGFSLQQIFLSMEEDLKLCFPCSYFCPFRVQEWTMATDTGRTLSGLSWTSSLLSSPASMLEK